VKDLDNRARPTSFKTKAVHGGGSGSIAVELTGNLEWYSRAMKLSSLRLYTAAYHQAYVQVFPWNGNKPLTTVYSPESGGLYGNDEDQGYWRTINNIPVDGGDYVGGITDVEIQVADYQHKITGVAFCSRAKATCTISQE
jgi:hypothetical protein